MVLAGEPGRQNAASQLKSRVIKQRLTEEIAKRTANSPTSFFKKRACLFQLDRVSKTFHVYLFNFLLIFVSDQD